MVCLLYVRLILFEKAPKCNDVSGGIFKEPVKPLLHLTRLNERGVIYLILSMVFEVIHDHLKQVIFSHTESHLGHCIVIKLNCNLN